MQLNSDNIAENFYFLFLFSYSVIPVRYAQRFLRIQMQRAIQIQINLKKNALTDWSQTTMLNKSHCNPNQKENLF